MKKQKLVADILLYFGGAAIPMLVLFLRSPIYTRIFSTDEYGLFALVNITLAYASTLCFSWIQSCALRYYNRYNKTQSIENYHQIITFLLSIGTSVIILLGLVWYLLSAQQYTRGLIVWGVLFFTSENILQVLLIPMRLEKKAAQFNLIKTIISVLSFALLLVLTFFFDLRIEAFFITPALFNTVVLIALIILKKVNFDFKFSRISKLDIKRFFKYGASSLGLGAAMFILISSDRYIIAWFYSNNEVGVYNQVYNLAQISLASIINAFQASSNPIIFKSFKEKPKQSKDILNRMAFTASYIYLPLTVLGLLMAKPFAEIMLGKDFSVGWRILPWVFSSTLIYGLIHFYSVRMKFFNQLRILVVGAFIAALINVALNFILIPKMGYQVAAPTTFSAYVIMLLIYMLYSKVNILTSKNFLRNIWPHLASLSFLTASHLVLIHFLGSEQKLFFWITESIVFLSLYYLFTFKRNPLKQKNYADE